MNAIELLIRDHNEVRGLFERFQAAQEAEDTATMSELAGTIFEELEVHTTIEEEIFYPAIREEGEEMGELVDESVQEHHVVDVLMDEMRELDDGEDDWVAKMTVLIENVEHHADEEEQEMFPDVSDQLDAVRLADLGDELAARKESLKAESSTRDELYRKAKELGIEGRSQMSKDELVEAVTAAQ